MYVLVMSPVETKTRLRRDDWSAAAIELLASDGVAGISIGRLATRLGVTRGSFYHHFRDREDLLRTMLEFWEEQSTISIRDEVRALELDPKTTLLVLMKTIRNRGASAFDVSFRAWAVHDPMAREVVEETDQIRLDYIRSLFLGIGFEELDAENRARLFLYYEIADPAVYAEQSPELRDQLIEHRHRFLTQGANES